MEEVKKKRKTKTSKEKVEKENLAAPEKLKILVTIVQRNKADFYMSVLEGFDVNMQSLFYAKGTAPTEIRNMLGIKDNGKAVIFSLVREDKIKEIIAAYEDKYFKTKNGNGIAFTIPVKSLIGVSIYQFLANLVGEV